MSASAMNHPRIEGVERLNASHAPSRFLIITPTYNERENITGLFAALAAIDIPVDIMVVDDGSPDKTGDAVVELAPSYPHRVILMRRYGKFGLGIAYTDAFHWVMSQPSMAYECIVQMDADFSHDPRMVPLLVEKARAYGASIGSRYVQGGAMPDWNHRRVLLSRAGNVYARLILRTFFPSHPIRDNTAGFMAWRRDVLEQVLRFPLYGDGYAFNTAIKLVAFRLGYPAIEVPIIFRDRRLGVSKLNRHIIAEAIWMPWRLGFTFRGRLPQATSTVVESSDVSHVIPLHDNSLQMWDTYYSSGQGSWFFARLIHWAREVYFGKLFASRVKKLGGPATTYLELGVGTAQTLERLQGMTAARCVGIEKTPRAHALGVEYAKHCEIVLGDGLRMPFPDQSFDVVYSLGLLEHFEPDEQVRLLREQARVTKQYVLVEVPARTLHMRAIMWFNRTVRKRKGVWADDELFSPARFRQKYPTLPFRYFFDWASGGMTCWFVLKPHDILSHLSVTA